MAKGTASLGGKYAILNLLTMSFKRRTDKDAKRPHLTLSFFKRIGRNSPSSFGELQYRRRNILGRALIGMSEAPKYCRQCSL
jgi:hypothetical protein